MHSDEIINKVRELRETGLYYRQIAEQLGLDTTTVFYMVNRNKQREQREKNKDNLKKYKEDNKDQAKISRKQYYEKNKEREYIQRKEWASKNKLRVNNYVRQRKFAKRNRILNNSKTNQVVIKNFYIISKCLSLLTKIPHNVDHIYPINGITSSGLHVPQNLQIITQAENFNKKNKSPEEFYGDSFNARFNNDK